MRRMRSIAACALLAALLLCAPVARPDAPPAESPTPREQLDQSLLRAHAAYDVLQNYSAMVEVRELVRGRTSEMERIFVVFDKSPLRMYVRWLPGGGNAGMQASYVESRDGPDHFLVLETGLRGLFGVLRFRLDSAFADTLYPHHFRMIDYDFGKQLDFAQGLYDRARELGGCRVEVLGIDQRSMPGHRLKRYSVLIGDDQADGLKFRRLNMAFDLGSGMPLHLEYVDLQDRVWGSYRFMSFEIDPLIDDALFELRKIGQ
ncbi:MAG: DUF1571 domain-containing protein [Candidatus Alcyoniella australis]|nr:DUF1571 domain-containing protein [Candidatus Alcyoniella australis]